MTCRFPAVSARERDRDIPQTGHARTRPAAVYAAGLPCTFGVPNMSLADLPDTELARWLDEDVPYLDLTTHGLGIGRTPGRAHFAARQPMTVCAIEEAARLFELCGCTVERRVDSGTAVAAKTPLLSAHGPAAGLHRAWKTAQTLVEIASGIASGASALVAAVRGVGCEPRIACTRKNVPGTRRLAVKAIVAGGATPHRLGLSDSVLVFAEHRCFVPAAELAGRLAALKREYPERRIVAEVSDIDEALALAALGLDGLQLEKFEPAAISELIARLGRPRPQLLAAGGINPANAAAYAATGADVLVTSAPYHAPPKDVAVTLEAAG